MFSKNISIAKVARKTTTSIKGTFFGGVVVVSFLLITSEFLVRAFGAVDFPLYDADSTIGYIPQVNQSGSFLNKNDWIFNELHMGSSAFLPGKRHDVLLIGDSIVFGGNPIKQSDRLGSQIERISGYAVWPISSGSWTLLNKLTYLRQNPRVVSDVDVVVFVLNTGDLDKASEWKCELTHPRSKPNFATWYLFKKYVFDFNECNKDMTPDLAIKNGDLLPELKSVLSAMDSKTHFILYPDKAQAADPSLWKLASQPLREFLQVAGARDIADLTTTSNWNTSFYRDGIHPNAAGNTVLAEFIYNAIKTSEQ